MRILQVCPVSFRTAGGGYAEYIRNISTRLAHKHQVSFFGSNPRNRFPRLEVMDGVNVERFRHFSWNNAYYFSMELPLRLRQVEFDVVHGHGFQAFPMHFSTLAKRKKLVVSPHFHGESHSVFRNSLLSLFKLIGRKTLLAADNIVAVSQYEKSLICREFGIDSNKVCVIPNGVDFDEFTHHRRTDREFRSILYVGRLESYKGVQYLVRVLPKLEKDIILEIVGTGPFKGYLEDLANKLKVTDRLRFYGTLKRGELLQKYADSDIFIMLSRFEAYSLVVAEALVAGTPCIVAETSALSEWVDDKHCYGLQYPIEIGELVVLINKMLERKKTTQEPVFSSDKILDWDEVVKRLEIMYEG